MTWYNNVDLFGQRFSSKINTIGSDAHIEQHLNYVTFNVYRVFMFTFTKKKNIIEITHQWNQCNGRNFDSTNDFNRLFIEMVTYILTDEWSANIPINALFSFSICYRQGILINMPILVVSCNQNNQSNQVKWYFELRLTIHLHTGINSILVKKSPNSGRDWNKTWTVL